MIEEGVTPILPAKELLKMGYRIAVFPLSGLYAATFAIKEVFMELRKTGITKGRRKMMVTFKDFNKFVDLQGYMALEKTYT
jgi:2-methylisocitrate lyase-like PEP mutase family enzyme